MNKFLFKSVDTDFQKLLQSIEAKLDSDSKNILYITYRVDKILKEIATLRIDKSLQSTVDKYFDDEETSPQTDLEDK